MIDDFKNSMLEKQVKQNRTLEMKLKKLQMDYEQLSSKYEAEQIVAQDMQLQLQSLGKRLEKKEKLIAEQDKQLRQSSKESQSLMERVSELEKHNDMLQIQLQQKQASTSTIRDGSKVRLSRLSRAPTGTDRITSIRPSLRFSQAPSVYSATKKSEKINPKQQEFGSWVLDEMLFSAQKLENCKDSKQSQSVLEPLRDVIALSGVIAEECDQKEMDSSLSESDKDLLFDMNYQISAALKLLVESTRNFASIGRPVEDRMLRDLDELISLVQNFFKVYNTMGLTPNTPPVVDFQDVLQEEVDEIALSIQDLLQVFEDSEPELDMVTDLVNHLVKHVDFAIIECSNHCSFNDNTEEVLEELARTRDLLLDQYDDYMDHPHSVKLMANAAYDIAKHSQDLLFILNPMNV
jgi:hypothetical protein